MPRRVMAVLRASMTMAIVIASVRLAWLGMYAFWGLQAVGFAMAEEPSLAGVRSLLVLVLGVLVGLCPVAVAVLLGAGVYRVSRGKARGIGLLRIGHGAAVVDAALWLVLALFYSLDTVQAAEDDPSVGICVFPILGAMTVRVLASVVSGALYAASWFVLERSVPRRP
jgi:hypothetical protein